MSNDTNEKPAALLETLMRQFLGEILPPPEAVEASKAYANGFLRDGDPEQSAEAIKAAAMQAAMMKTAAECGEEPPVDMRGAIDRLFETGSIDKNPAEHDKALQELEESFRDIKAKSAEVIGASKTRQELTIAAIGAVGDGAALLSRIYSSVAADTGTEKDTFIRNGLEGHPDTVAEAVNVCKDVLASAARSAAVIMGGSFAMGASILPNWKADKTGGAALKMLLFMLYDEDDITGSVLQSLPKTMEYMRQHAPEHAAELEACAREEVKKAFLPLLEYVNGLGREDAEPVEEAAEGKKLSRAEQETKYGNTNLIPIDAHREPKDKLTQMLFGGKIKIGDVKKAINVNTDTKPVQTYLSVIPDPDFMEGIRSIYGKGDLCFSREHWRFYRAIMTEILQGNEWTTFQRLYQIEYHQLGRTRPGAISKEKEKEMMDMLYFFQKQFIEADITGEKAYYKKNADLQSMDDVPKGALVNFEIWPHYINHNKVDNAIHFLNIPILLKYALAHNHIATIPPKLFQNKAFKRQTEDASDVADMLIHWLMMKNVRNYELAYETVFNYMGVKSSDKTAAAKSRRTRLRNIVFKWMNYWSKELHLFSWDANNAQYIKIILPKDELEKKKHTLFTADKIKALM